MVNNSSKGERLYNDTDSNWDFVYLEMKVANLTTRKSMVFLRNDLMVNPMRTNLIETAVVWLGIRPLIWQLNGAVELFVAIGLHFLELDLRPRVHGDGLDEADMDTKATMLTARRERWSDPWGERGWIG
ncbi:hypothetical protein F0562_030798 [Nyssa sinensis]|uniref:Uncharacterized protein n=1 Tax=Nyssa sinensis TaxID=561372 RepID=A0A5J5B3V6_9ASTE|nr:hypothetical protein F0562_030798 [Nyssa sinensis]